MLCCVNKDTTALTLSNNRYLVCNGPQRSKKFESFMMWNVFFGNDKKKKKPRVTTHWYVLCFVSCSFCQCFLCVFHSSKQIFGPKINFMDIVAQIEFLRLIIWIKKLIRRDIMLSNICLKVFIFFDKYKMKNANNYFGVLVKKINIIKRF
jgi:hypothetical protein